MFNKDDIVIMVRVFKVVRSAVYFYVSGLVSMNGVFKDISNAFTCTVPTPCGHLRFTLVHSELKKKSPLRLQ
jgi:hypothetical protein